MAKQPGIVLVHGAGHNGTCWSLVEPLLRQRGFKTSAPSLSGQRGNPRHPLLITMERYGADVISAAEATGAPCILVGHSMGGFAISQAAERRPELFSKLIYMTAMVPKPGKSSVLQMPPPPPSLSKAGRLKLNGTIEFPLEAALEHFYNRSPPEVRQRVPDLLCPQPMRPSFSQVHMTEQKAGAIPKYYIECTDDRTIPIESQRSMQRHWPMAGVASIDTDHMPNLSAPNAVAELIAKFADA